MLPVSNDYKQAILAPKRRILGKVSISYSDPFLDPSVDVSANETARISQTIQAADTKTDPTKKWASLDGTWVLDGTWYLCPDKPEYEKTFQIGWWGSSLSGAGGAFAEPYPELTITFSARPVRAIAVVGDTARGEYPVDFSIEIYADDTLATTETVVGNDQVETSLYLGNQDLTGITKFVLRITRWSHPGRTAKILECFALIREVYTGDDIFVINLLEEREFSNGSLPVGNVSANELTINISNIDRRFDAGNTESPLYGLIKPNREIKAWLGLEMAEPKVIQTALFGMACGMQRIQQHKVEWIPLGVFWSGEWTVPEEDIYAETSARDRLDLLTRSTFSGPVYQNISVYDLLLNILNDTGFPYWVDEALKNQVIPWAYFDNETHRECLRLAAEASLSQIYADRNGVIRVEGPDYLAATKTTADLDITTNQYFSKDNPANYGELANYIEIETSPLTPLESAEVYRSETPIEIDADEAKTVTVFYNQKPVMGAVVTLSDEPDGLSIQNVNSYSWGADITVSGATESGTFVIVITGQVLQESGGQKIIAQDADSIQANGKLTYTYAKNPLIQTAETARAIAEKCLALSKDARRDLELKWRGDMALELGDRINVPDSKTTTADFFVTSTELSYDGGLICNVKGKKVI